MDKAARIKAFVDIERKKNVLSVRKITPLFEKLLGNVRKEYKRFHRERKPKVENLEIPINKNNETSLHASYLQDQQYIDAFVNYKQNQELPFAISQELQSESFSLDEEIVFPDKYALRTSYFINSSFSMETFYQIQRQHKIWWMKYGANPGKYSISDQKSESFYKLLSIRSNVEESPVDVERIRLFSLKDCIKSKTLLSNYMSKVPNRKKEAIPDVIETVVELQVASLTLLLDAVNLSDDYTAFHRRSAPYQLAIIAEEPTKDLIDFARYVELLIHDTDDSIEVLNNSKLKIGDQAHLEKQLEQLDCIGIPYTLLLDQQTLEQGLFKLRNRNTTLSETIHISDVTNYLIKIFTSK